ncbi:hypothetical protein C0995_001299 [Termitomyces sp. Mi166|nr:hypothetical protein C0995_001299 [Termitomyces sp. Mi166\
MTWTLNTQNIELPWYTSWNQHLMKLLRNKNPQLLLSPQYLLWVVPSKAIEPEGQKDAKGDVEIDSVYHGEVTRPSFLTMPQNAVSEKSKVEGWLMATPSQSSLSDEDLISSHHKEDMDKADTDKADMDNPQKVLIAK